MATPQTFEQYREERLGPEVQGVTDWSQAEDAFNAGRATLSPQLGGTVVVQHHSYKTLEEKLRVDQEWADRYYLSQWDWSKPVRKPRKADQ